MKKKKKVPAARAMANIFLLIVKEMICTAKNAFYEEKKSACGARNGQKTNTNYKKMILH